MEVSPSTAWIGRPSLRVTTWNAHALNTKESALRRRRYAAVHKLAEGADILMLQEVHGDDGDFAALAGKLRVSHMVLGSPAPSAAAGGTAIAISSPK